MKRHLYGLFTLIVLLVAAALLTTDIQAQGTADAKRGLKAAQEFYKIAGMIEVDLRAMRSTLLMTGYVPTEELKALADELAGQVRGVKDVRNRILVREAELCSGVTDEALLAKIKQKIERDEELARAFASGKFELGASGRNMVVTGKLKDWALALSLIDSIRIARCVNTIDFDKLKY
jgi:hypothetical protein